MLKSIVKLKQLHLRLKRLKPGNQREYPIFWLDQIDQLANAVQKRLDERYAVVITNESIHRLYKSLITKVAEPQNVLVISDGEDQKNLNVIESLVEELLKLRADRKTTLIALGGGVVGDITGFLASTYMRGVSYLQIPTTLLAMVDSSVGGKTAVNSALGKNMIGTFYQPLGVFICIDFLKTLPEREFRSGLAEVVKSAIIKSGKFYKYIASHLREINEKDPSVLLSLSYESVRIKKWVVQKDEKESNLRGILNFGHTLAHAIENFFEYKKINHGEAVSIGLGFAAYFSHKRGYISEDEWEGFNQLLTALHLPTSLKDVSRITGVNEQALPTISQLTFAMKRDKKNKMGEIYFVFIRKIGKYLLPQRVEIKEVQEILSSYFKSQNCETK